jgi:hypothetical protein
MAIAAGTTVGPCEVTAPLGAGDKVKDILG